MKRILLTGASGYIGSHTCLILLKNGYEVYALDSFINSSPLALERVLKLANYPENKENNLHVYKGDVRNADILERIFLDSTGSGENISSVIHFAGLKSVSESISNPLRYWDFNVNGAINLLKNMKKYDCYTMVFSSSATIYGNIKKDLVDESSVINPVNTYGNTKSAVEKLLNDLFSSCKNKLKIANLRYFNPIGAHRSGEIGENPIGIPNNLFPYITQVASGKLKQLKIFGKDWPTHDGTGIRDYIHVMDVAEGHLKVLEYLQKEANQILNLNLGTGLGTSVLDLVNSFQRVNNIKIPYVFSPRREGDVAKIVADNSLAKSILNWSPERTIDQMCIDGWKWQSKNPNGFLDII